jgi:hypothetical protein
MTSLVQGEGTLNQRGMNRANPFVEKLSKSELFSDQLAETLFYFRVTWDWRFPPAFRVSVYVVLAATTPQIATSSNELSNKVAASQSSTPRSLVFTSALGTISSSSIIS